MSIKQRLFYLVAAAFAFFNVVADAQTVSSTVLARLTDPHGAAVPGAKITITDKATATTRTSTSDNTGTFRFLDLNPGTYSLRVESGGFKTFEMNEIILQSAETRDLGSFPLQLGEVTSTVTVEAAATQVQTSSSQGSPSVGSSQLNELALKGRDPFGFVGLVPGVVDQQPDREIADPNQSARNLSINGMMSNQKDSSFDGVSALDQGGAQSTYIAPSVDAVAEVVVHTNGLQAEFGRMAGGAVNVITKSGTKDFHGTAYWSRRHENLDANTFFDNRSAIQRPIYRYSIPGGTIGGPLFIPKVFNKERNKLFFFFSEEYAIVAEPTTTSTVNEPTALERAGNFSQSFNSSGALITIKDPTTGTAFPGNIIPVNRIDPTGLQFLNLFLLPNGYTNPAPGQKYTSNFIASATPWYRRSDTIAKLDYQVNSKLSMYLRYGRDTRTILDEFSVAPGLGPEVNFEPGNQTVFHATYVFSPTMVNELIAGDGRNSYGFNRDDTAWYRSASFNPPTLSTIPTGRGYFPLLPAASYSGGQLSNPASFNPDSTTSDPIPYANWDIIRTLRDDLSKVVGSHSFKAGFYYEYNNKVEPSAGYNYPGTFNFGSTANNPLDTNNGYANALLGIFQSYTQATNRVFMNPHFNELEGYVQDNWRVSPRVTIDLGVRWYHPGIQTDNTGSFSGFYPQLWNASQAPKLYRYGTVNGQEVAVNPITGATTSASLVGTIVPGSGNAADGMRVNGLNGNGDFYSYPFLAFTPRLGLAWDVFGNGKMAIRASFGSFFSRANANYIISQDGAPPVSYTPTIYYSTINQIAADASSGALSPTAATTASGHQDLEQSHQVHFEIQRDLGHGTVVSVGYVGNFDRHQPETLDLNPIPEFAYANSANLYNNTEMNANLLRTAYPGMGAILYTTDANSALNYHGLQTSLQHRLSRGLQFGVNYTFSKALGTQPCGAVNTNGNSSCDNAFESLRGQFYGPLPQDRSQYFVVNYSYNIPGTNIKFLKNIVNDWVWSGIATAQTGAPVSPACSSTNSGPANTDPSLSGVTARCQEIANPNSFTHTFFENFNTSAFTIAAPGTFGNSGLNILRQPSWVNFDTTLTKKIPIKSERVVMRLAFQAYNVLNHTEFSTIGTTYALTGTTQTNSTWGQYTATNQPRVLQSTIRIQF